MFKAHFILYFFKGTAREQVADAALKYKLQSKYGVIFSVKKGGGIHTIPWQWLSTHTFSGIRF